MLENGVWAEIKVGGANTYDCFHNIVHSDYVLGNNAHAVYLPNCFNIR
jgi:hypothetical protein